MQQEPPFDWHAFLEKETHTPDELKDAVGLAKSWVTCACGVQCARIPRHTDGAPEDFELRRLGVIFLSRIKNMVAAERALGFPVLPYSQQAVTTLREIEVRAEELLKELKCNSPSKPAPGSTSTASTT